MPSNVNPTVRRRRLGQELRRLRELKGMTAEEVAERLLVSQSKISRLGERPPFHQPARRA